MDLSRFEDFKPKFDKRLRFALERSVVLSKDVKAVTGITTTINIKQEEQVQAVASTTDQEAEQPKLAEHSSISSASARAINHTSENSTVSKSTEEPEVQRIVTPTNTKSTSSNPDSTQLNTSAQIKSSKSTTSSNRQTTRKSSHHKPSLFSKENFVLKTRKSSHHQRSESPVPIAQTRSTPKKSIIASCAQTKSKSIKNQPTKKLTPASTRIKSTSKSSKSSTNQETKNVVYQPSSPASASNVENRYLTALKSANLLMKNLYKRIEKDTDNFINKPNRQQHWNTQIRKVETEAEILLVSVVAGGDTKMWEQLLALFKSSNEFECYRAIAQAKHAGTAVKNLFQKRFANIIDYFSVECLKRFNTLAAIEDFLKQKDDPLELYVIKEYGVQWEAQYRKMQKVKAEELHAAVVYVRDYNKMMTKFMASNLCVDPEDFDEFEKEVLPELKSIETLTESLKQKAYAVLQEVKKPMVEKVLENCKAEEASLDKAIDYACDQYKALMAPHVDEWTTLENSRHAVIYSIIRRSFKTVSDFEYTKRWKWPVEVPGQIKEQFKNVQEERERIKQQAVCLLKRLNQMERRQLFAEFFPFPNDSESTRCDNDTLTFPQPKRAKLEQSPEALATLTVTAVIHPASQSTGVQPPLSSSIGDTERPPSPTCKLNDCECVMCSTSPDS